jgi:hypothetical protein
MKEPSHRRGHETAFLSSCDTKRDPLPRSHQQACDQKYEPLDRPKIEEKQIHDMFYANILQTIIKNCAKKFHKIA